MLLLKLLRLTFLLTFVALSSFGFAQPLYNIKQGDILFQDMDCGPTCDAIEKVTKGWKGRNFSHIGLVDKKNDSLYVIEAIGKNVHYTAIDKFLNRSKNSNGKPKIVIGRLKQESQHLLPGAFKFARQQLGTLYDDTFLYENGKYYCSELIYDSFKAANNNSPFFELKPMTYNDPETGRIFPVWEEYFKARDMPVPEGLPGCNPGGLSLSDKLDIIESLY